jgi:hypothetical protein
MKYIFILVVFFNPYTVTAQNQISGKDSTAFLDSVLREMDEVLEGLLPAKSFLSVTAGSGTGFYNFRTSSSQFSSQKKLLLSAGLNYIHKSGFGISSGGYIVSDSTGLLPYQLSITPSYDHIERGKWAIGIAYTKYFTKKDLSFYTTPLSNDVYAYYNYKKWWIQPTVAVSYGWGSRKQLQQKRADLLGLRQRLDPGLVAINNEESVSDFSALISLRHSFSFYRLFHQKDMISVTPVLALNSGTQNFGFNTSYQSRNQALNKFLPGNQYISNTRGFDMQSASTMLRVDYSINKFFLQSQFLLDYYLHPAEKRLNNAVSVIAGVNL